MRKGNQLTQEDNQMLELSDHNFKAVIIKTLQNSIACFLEINEKNRKP